MGKMQSIKIKEIVLDNSIYPRNSIDHKRISMFEENMRDGFEFDPIHLQKHPDEPENIISKSWKSGWSFKAGSGQLHK